MVSLNIVLSLFWLLFVVVGRFIMNKFAMKDILTEKAKMNLLLSAGKRNGSRMGNQAIANMT
jgi:hypothetical protein